jgi:hypothetical protein
MGSFLFNPLASYIVNPTGHRATIIIGDIAYFKADIADRVPMML